MENMTIYDACRSVPETAKKAITAGRLKGKTDINPMWRIKRLTEQFGPCGIGWYYKPVRKWMETHGDEIAAFVDIELYVKIGGEWSMPIAGTGGSMFAARQKDGVYVSDECYKMATTDAISVACKQLGVGADVYWDADRTKYDDPKAPTTMQQAEAPVDKQRAELIGQMREQLQRTGYGTNAVLKTYKASDVGSLSNLQIKDCIKRLKGLPNREVSA
jgi:hypothetical protein|nr:MAG TPA: DNA repair protein-like protein [Caudoviricetes sp.]